MDARQGRRQGEDRLRRRIEIERRCTWGAVKWKWDAVAFGRRRWLGSERGGGRGRRPAGAPPAILSVSPILGGAEGLALSRCGGKGRHLV